MLRSMLGETSLVQAALNAGRAITLCWMANAPSSSKSMTTAVTRLLSTPESIDFGTMKLPTKPTAYRKEKRKITYAARPNATPGTLFIPASRKDNRQ